MSGKHYTRALVMSVAAAATLLLIGSATLPSGAASTASAVAKRPAVRRNGLTLAIGGHRAHIAARPTKLGHADMLNGPLVYKGGPVMQSGVTNTIILWNPGHLQNGATTGYSAKYSSLAMRWFADQPASPLYANLNQYYQLIGGKGSFIQRDNKAPKLFRDTRKFPTGQCTNPDTGVNCITDANLVAEVRHFVVANNLPSGLKYEYFVLTPNGEGSCFDSTCQYPSYTRYCAYHSYAPRAAGSTSEIIYADMPYPTDPGGHNCYYAPGTYSQTSPSGDVEADANINLMSHEQYESVTDPLINAWTDSTGSEIGDVCAWQFGDVFPSGGDLQINGHPYDTQSEGDNHNLALGGTGCVFAGP